MPWAGLGGLGLWLKSKSSPALSGRPSIPAGDGPLLIVRVSLDAHAAMAPALARLQAVRPDLRVLTLPAEDDDVSNDIVAARELIMLARPLAVLLLGYQMPSALVMAARQDDVPVFMAEVRFQGKARSWGLRAAGRRALLRDLESILVTDQTSEAALIRMGADPDRVVLTGPVAEIKDPPRCTESERAAFAQLLSGRHAWLAANIPQSEEQAVLEAHRAASRQSHRALLFLAPRDPSRIDPLAEQLEAEGLIVARRSLDEEPTEEVHVMITDGPTEKGLWYRLASVTYIGGTLSDGDDAICHPFEPAALGSAIVHGPHIDHHATQWQQLDRADAARLVADGPTLAATIAEMTQPDIVARLAEKAWMVSTGGADVAQRIAAPILDLLPKETA